MGRIIKDLPAIKPVRRFSLYKILVWILDTLDKLKRTANIKTKKKENN